MLGRHGSEQFLEQALKGEHQDRHLRFSESSSSEPACLGTNRIRNPHSALRIRTMLLCWLSVLQGMEERPCVIVIRQCKPEPLKAPGWQLSFAVGLGKERPIEGPQIRGPELSRPPITSLKRDVHRLSRGPGQLGAAVTDWDTGIPG